MTVQPSSQPTVLFEGTPTKTPDDVRDARVRELESRVTELERAQHELRERESRFRAAFEQSIDALIITDPADPGRVLEANPAACRLFGYSPEEFRGLCRSSILDGSDPAVAALLQQRKQAGHARAELTYRRKDGTRFTGELATSLFSNHAGQEQAVAVIRDVSERKRGEEALRQSESRYRMLHETLRDPFVQVSMDGRIIDCNELYCQMLGYSRSELSELSYQQLTPERWDALERRIVEEQILARGYSDIYEKQYRRKDGTLLTVELRTVLCRDLDGEPIAMWALVRDVTEQKRGQERVATIARLYEVLSRANEAIVRTRDERCLYEAMCRILADVGGFPLAWIGLVNGPSVLPAACAGSASAYLDEVRIEVDGSLGMGPTGTAIREDRTVVNDDFDSNPRTTPWRDAAQQFGFRASASFPLHRQGTVIGTLTLYATEPGAFDGDHVRLFEALCADVSYALDAIAHERRRAEGADAIRNSERNLREVDQRKNEFLAVLSHELRNPLAPIANSLYILDHAPPGGEQATRAKAVIGRQVTQLSNLINDLLDVTRISRNKVRIQREPLELNELVQRALEDNRSFFDRAQVQLSFAPATRPAPVLADRTRIAQVVGNLLQNSAKFTSKGGLTEVSIAIEGQEALIRVTDNGVGMDRDTLARLFQPFMQADKTLDRSRGGLGLGLTLVKGLVELHGGSVSAKSAGLGKGAEFVVRLPLDTDATREHSAERDRVGRARRVLVIEDNADAAESLQAALQLSHHEVIVAYSGPEGIAKARAERPEVVLCDIGLPGMDGFAVARAFREDDLLKDTFLVALSGYALPEDLERAAEAGFHCHLPKPPSLKVIEKLLAEAGTDGWRVTE